jgi:TPR repeat protein
MITAKEYFERYIAWKKRPTSAGEQAHYESYTAMDVDTLIHEADYNIPGAVEELGERYLFGLKLDQNVDKAIELLTAAAEAGHPDAMHLLADIYRSDQHGKKDLSKYFPLLTAAAERGSWKSMFNLACAYYQGNLAYDGYGFPMNHTEALRWSLRSIDMCQELLTLFFTNPCTQELKDYFGDVYDTYLRAVSAASRQIFEGDGVERDVEHAYELVHDAQEFHNHFLGAECGKFTAILRRIDQERQK